MCVYGYGCVYKYAYICSKRVLKPLLAGDITALAAAVKSVLMLVCMCTVCVYRYGYVYICSKRVLQPLSTGDITVLAAAVK